MAVQACQNRLARNLTDSLSLSHSPSVFLCIVYLESMIISRYSRYLPCYRTVLGTRNVQQWYHSDQYLAQAGRGNPISHDVWDPECKSTLYAITHQITGRIRRHD